MPATATPSTTRRTLAILAVVAVCVAALLLGVGVSSSPAPERAPVGNKHASSASADPVIESPPTPPVARTPVTHRDPTSPSAAPHWTVHVIDADTGLPVPGATVRSLAEVDVGDLDATTRRALDQDSIDAEVLGARFGRTFTTDENGILELPLPEAERRFQRQPHGVVPYTHANVTARSDERYGQTRLPLDGGDVEIRVAPDRTARVLVVDADGRPAPGVQLFRRTRRSRCRGHATEPDRRERHRRVSSRPVPHPGSTPVHGGVRHRAGHRDGAGRARRARAIRGADPHPAPTDRTGDRAL